MAAAAPTLFFGDLRSSAGCAVVCSAAVLLVGCRSTQSPVEPLTSEQETTIRSTFRELGAGHPVSERPTVPAEGWRWSDVAQAAKLAAGDVEAAVVRAREFVDDEGRPGWRFEIATIEDWPGELIVVRVEDGELLTYRASATVGLYRDRAQRAERLVKAFHARLRALGQAPRFDD